MIYMTFAMYNEFMCSFLCDSYVCMAGTLLKKWYIFGLVHQWKCKLKCILTRYVLLITMTDLLNSHDKGKQIDMALLDFSKAFDTLAHKQLLHNK